MIKMLRLKITLIFVFVLKLLPAQVNLVPNPSFEADNHAPVITTFFWNHYGDWRKDSLYSKPNNNLILAAEWFPATSGTPDALNSDKSNLLGFKTKTARTGSGRIGIISGICKNGLVSWLLYKETYSEYVECKLNQPLVAGKLYCVRYYVALDRKSNFANNRFGFAITKDSVRYPNTHIQLSGNDPDAHINEANDHYITSDEGWVMICDTFIAKGGEQFLTLGSFATDSPKRIHKVKKTEHTSLRVNPFNKFAYYYIDDVSLLEVQPGEAVCSAPRDSVARNNIVFMLDISGSMDKKGLLDAAKNSIIPLVNTIPPGDHITIVAYNDNATILAENITAADTAAIRIALEKIKPAGGTNAVAGFNLAYGAIRKRMIDKGTNKIIVLTDGKVYLPKKEKEKIITAAEEENIVVSIVFFGDEIPDQMEKFAEAAGGNANIVKDGNPEEALRKEVPATIKDTPYGERDAGKIVLWETFTKVVFPALIVLVVWLGFHTNV